MHHICQNSIHLTSSVGKMRHSILVMTREVLLPVKEGM